MQYLKAIIKETLRYVNFMYVHEDNFSFKLQRKLLLFKLIRMYPTVIGNGRCLTKDTVIHGYQIPKGVSCMVLNKQYLIEIMFLNFAFRLK